MICWPICVGIQTICVEREHVICFQRQYMCDAETYNMLKNICSAFGVLSCLVLCSHCLLLTSLFTLVLCLVLSCLVLSLLVVSWLVLSCLVVSRRVLCCLVLSCLVLSCLVFSCLVSCCFVFSCRVMSCLVFSCLGVSCLVLSYLILKPLHFVLGGLFVSLAVLSLLLGWLAFPLVLSCLKALLRSSLTLS